MEQAGSSSSPSSSMRTHIDELEFLDYLSSDFSYLRRFILASHQMVRLLETETAQCDENIQEKLVLSIEIAKETLSEAGASVRPFVACPAHLIHHRQSYFDMLTAARSLVPHMIDASAKLRLRRLLLPLTSTSRFRVTLLSNAPSMKKHDPSLPTWWNNPNASPRVESLAPSPAALFNSPAPRKRIRRSSGSAVLKFASSPMSYSTCASDTSAKSFVGRSAANLKRSRASPYPSPLLHKKADSNSPIQGSVAAESHSSSSSVPPVYSPPPQNNPYSSQPGLLPSQPPLAHVAQPSPKQLSLLQQQHRDLSAGCGTLQKEQDPSTRWDWPSQTRSSLSGIDCNLPDSKGALGLPPMATNGEILTPATPSGCDDDWGPVLLRDWSKTGGTPEPSPGLTWCTSWDEVPGPKDDSPSVMTLLATSFPSEPEPPKPLADSTCIVM